MRWLGKLLGGALGFMVGGPLGAVLGAAIGHNFDRGVAGVGLEGRKAGERERAQTAFATSTFLVMGHLAKADGRVSEAEIAAARAAMAELRLTPQQQRAAIELFRQGKQPDFDLDAVLDGLRRECEGHSELLRQFLKIQFEAAYADGAPDLRERALLLRICERLGLSRFQFEALDAYARAQQQFRAAGRGGGHRAGGAHAPMRPRASLADAYATLGLSPDAGNEDVKRAYRRLLSRHHPDKLAARGVSGEMTRLATEKTRQIKDAYERIKEARGL